MKGVVLPSKTTTLCPPPSSPDLLPFSSFYSVSARRQSNQAASLFPSPLTPPSHILSLVLEEVMEGKAHFCTQFAPSLIAFITAVAFIFLSS